MGEILTQITRIDNNIQNSLAKVAAKGVTVSEDATSDDLPGLIEQISGTEDLTAELDAQESKLNALLASLDGKAAGGGEEDNRSLYQRVEYITSDANSYFVTDFIADNECGMEVVASFPAFADHAFMGSREDSGSSRFYAPYPLSATSSYCGFNAATKISTSTLTIDTIYRMQVNFLNCRLANVYDEMGDRKGSTSISATLTAHSFPIYIFCFSYAGQSAGSSRVLSLYCARCSRKNEVVREYIPCYRKSDGEIGLYEKFTGQFLTNAGTGTFTKGADVDW